MSLESGTKNVQVDKSQATTTITSTCNAAPIDLASYKMYTSLYGISIEMSTKDDFSKFQYEQEDWTSFAIFSHLISSDADENKLQMKKMVIFFSID